MIISSCNLSNSAKFISKKVYMIFILKINRTLNEKFTFENFYDKNFRGPENFVFEGFHNFNIVLLKEDLYEDSCSRYRGEGTRYL